MTAKLHCSSEMWLPYC